MIRYHGDPCARIDVGLCMMNSKTEPAWLRKMNEGSYSEPEFFSIGGKASWPSSGRQKPSMSKL